MPTASFAAILAMGYPVAFDASALERETRGFISMTMTRPSAGLTANCTFEPPVSTPISSITVRATHRAGAGTRLSVSVIGRCHGDRVTGVHAHWIDVLDRADDDEVVLLVADDLEFELLPAEEALFDEHFVGGRLTESPEHLFVELSGCFHDAAALSHPA